jgi:hypothetical protein
MIYQITFNHGERAYTVVRIPAEKWIRRPLRQRMMDSLFGDFSFALREMNNQRISYQSSDGCMLSEDPIR